MNITFDQLYLFGEAHRLSSIDRAILKEFHSLHNAGKRIFLSIQTLCSRLGCRKSTIHASIKKLKSLGIVQDVGWLKRVRVRCLVPDAFPEIIEATDAIAPDEDEIPLFNESGAATDVYRDNSDLFADDPAETTTPTSGQVIKRLLQNTDTNTSKPNTNNNIKKVINKIRSVFIQPVNEKDPNSEMWC